MNTKKIKSNKLTKKLNPTNDVFVQFSEEELDSLGLKPGDKLSVYPQADGSIILEKFATMEIELDQLSREALEALIGISCDQDKSMNDVIGDLLMEFIKANNYDEGVNISDEEFAKEVFENQEAFEGQLSDEEFAEEYDNDLAFLPLPVYEKITRILDEYDARKRTLGVGTDPDLSSMAKFLSISYGGTFPENQVRSIIEMSNEDNHPRLKKDHKLNFHQRIQNIIFCAEDLERQLGRTPSVWDVTDALNCAGIDVKRNQVSAILEIEEEGKKKECCSKPCGSKSCRK